MKIPVLTVLKNGTILKHIYLQNPDPEEPESSPESCEIDEFSGKKENEEEVLMVGRHPDCHVVLDHPSISRYHLRIQLQNRCLKFIVTDLSSVHGTWVSGQKIVSQVAVDLQEGDTLRLGASTRIYKLRWVAMDSAFDFENTNFSAVSQEQDMYHQVVQCEFPFLQKYHMRHFHGKSLIVQEQENYQSPSVKKPEDPWATDEPSAPPLPDSANFESLDEAFTAIEVLADKENQGPLGKRSQKREPSSLWSRRYKSTNFLSLNTENVINESFGSGLNSNFNGDSEVLKENYFAGATNNGMMYPEYQGSSLSKAISKRLSEEGEEMYVSDKENMTPRSSTGKLRPKKKSTSENSSRLKQGRISQKNIAERIPFQSLPKGSGSNINQSAPPLSTTSRNSNVLAERKESSSANQTVDQRDEKAAGEVKKKWHMVVDSSSLINDESRRSLKLLEGLKGTHLIIPRMVIRELDCLKRRGNGLRFRKENDASLALQWIEECMVKMRWWIHVQSSAESMPVAVTPPASPRTKLSDGSNETGDPLIRGSLMEIISPTAEDHILECALLFKKLASDGQLVLLTTDVTLKIKAMAEGLICETAKDFCESLVSPYSERFLWAESTPRGPTWDSLDDICIKENMRKGEDGLKKKATEGAKGLKLILLHNSSHYGQHLNLLNSVKS
ncbi:FHA domain-containing protein PS1 isoform X1 [Amborella trichopoda]|uniref:FHA domain-containing protein PS1 isoform X1 n=1 Tax=Amborella trichopoda TaxID=13333 RepID=UPI0005D3D88D|nr:FHA domain-containing protein PS1 isoform X1 [Amborella trichopoda]|eukprot:XP_011624389.1 FHA domain-containing protein PS1 isoform X1 [Amborella trichopoda]